MILKEIYKFEDFIFQCKLEGRRLHGMDWNSGLWNLIIRGCSRIENLRIRLCFDFVGGRGLCFSPGQQRMVWLTV